MLCMGTHELMQNFKQKLSEQRLTYHSCHRFCGNALLRTTFSFVLIIFFFLRTAWAGEMYSKHFTGKVTIRQQGVVWTLHAVVKYWATKEKWDTPFHGHRTKSYAREREYHCIHVGSTAADNEHTQKTYTENTVLISINNRQHNWGN